MIEDRSICKKMFLVAADFSFGYLLLFGLLIGVGYSQDDSEASRIEDATVSSSGSPSVTTTPMPALEANSTRVRPTNSSFEESGCPTPAEPPNGVRKLSQHKEKIDEGVTVALGSVFIYNCDPGYELIGDPIILCGYEGLWSPIPVCSVRRCNPLNSVSTVAKCFRLGRWVDCNSPVLPETRARLSCSPGYLQDTSSTKNRSRSVECVGNGKWEPEPIECRPACGLARRKPTTDYPWRASLYRKWEERGAIEFECGATILRSNLVLTAASCVYDGKTNSTLDVDKFFVMAGNTRRVYDYPFRDPQLVEKSAVKSVHVNCDYRGKSSEGDIALVELEDPFEFTQLRLPACLSDAARVELEPNAYGSLAEFGSLTQGGRPLPDTDDLPIVKTQPYVPHERCKDSGKLRNRNALTKDKFCAGFSNSTSECVSSRGGGLVFKRNDLWYVMGVTSETTNLVYSDGDENSFTCENYTIYTNVSEYTAWIADVMFNIKQNKSHPPCHDDGIGKLDGNKTPLADAGPACPAPPQPENGGWAFHPSLCSNDKECRIDQGSPLRPGTQLIYACSAGYKVKGNAEVYCGFSGNWSAIPVCTEIECDSLNSVATAAYCYDRFGKWISCEPAVPPGTRAEVYCQLGYRTDLTLSTFRTKTVKCGENGKWTPSPVRCLPVCGVATTHQTPFILNGTSAELSDFPWHATLYLEKNSSRGSTKEFICGATIIHTNFLLTAAHCVYDERTQTTTDPGKLFVMAGNIFRDFDHPFHNPMTVVRTAVRGVYRPCKYYGLRGNYASDIALLELESPFVFSGVLLPACLDVEGYDKQILEPGAWGRVAGFGRTATGATSGALQTLTLPYVSYNQCKTSRNAEKNDVLISSDKFCAGYTNGSAVCEGDSGGGLVFQKGELWYVLGIVSVGLGVDLDNGEKTCDKYSYSLYTKVSEHMTWIQDVMFQRAQLNIYPLCDENV